MSLDLGRQLGPLPLGGWLAAIGAGGVLAFVLNRRATAGASNTATDANATTVGPSAAVTTPTYLGAGGYDSTSSVTAAPPSTVVASSPLPSVAPANNDAWRQDVVTALSALGWSAVGADATAAKYLRGDPLSTQEGTQLEVALRAIGPPPTPVYDPPNVAAPPAPSPAGPPPPAPSPAPAPPPPAWPKSYTVRSGDSFWRIAGTFYGNPTMTKATHIAAANGLAVTAVIHPGQTLTIPAP